MIKDYYKKMLENLDEGVCFIDKSRKIIFWNNVAEKITGYKSSEVIGNYCNNNILHPIEDFDNYIYMNEDPQNTAINWKKKSIYSAYLNHSKDYPAQVFVKSVPFKNDDGNLMGDIQFFVKSDTVDIENFDIKTTKYFRRLLYEDPLTGLLNRNYLMKYFNLKLIETYKLDNDLDNAIVLINIRNYKAMVHNFGQVAIDSFMVDTSKKILDSAGKNHRVFKWTNSSFIILCNKMNKIYINEFADALKIILDNLKCRVDIRNDIDLFLNTIILKKDDTVNSVTETINNKMKTE